MIQTWFKIFYRNSKKNWLNILINVLGLTLGLAGLLIVLLYFQDEKGYNSKNPNKDSIYRVVHKMSDGDIWTSSTAVEGAKYKEEIPEVTSVYMSNDWYDSSLLIAAGKKVYSRDILMGQPNFFEFFPFEVVKGSVEDFEKVRNHMALSEEKAKALFGNVSLALGETVEINKRVYKVALVYKITGKHYYMPQIVVQYEKEPKGHWGNFSFGLFIKTTQNAESNSLIEKMDNIWFTNQVEPQSKIDGVSTKEWEEKYGTKVLLESLTDIRLKSLGKDAGPEGKGNYQLILIMLTLSILLIIISCVNFINLSTASATQRAKEVGVKKTLGLSKLTLTRQFVLEIVLQGIIAFVLAVILVELLLPYFNDFMRKSISIIDGTVIYQVAIIAVVISFIIGNIPAVYLANFKSVEVLKGNISRSKRGRFARSIMLGFQFLISGFFLIGSLIIYKQVNYMMNKDLGYNGNQVITVSLNDPENRYKKYLLAKKELIKHPNIEVVTSNYFLPGGGNSNSTNVGYKNLSVQTNSNAMDFEYMDMVDMKVIKGRGLQANLASDTIKNVLINETLAKAFGIYDNPLGKKISTGFSSEDNDGKNLNVIGMVKDYHIYGMDAKIPPIIMMHWNSFDWMKQNFWVVQFKIKSNDIEKTIADIEDYWKQNVEQGYPFSYQFLNKRFARTYRKYQKQKTIFTVLTVIVIVISLLGLFALATLSIQQRLKEVAIRKTLGASVQEIMYQLIKNFVRIVLIASIVLIPVAYYFMQSWLDNFVYRIDMPLLPYLITPIILMILVFLVVGLKAFKATKVDLIKYLKFE